MAGGTQKLSARTVKTASEPGRYADGGGLYLQVGASGSKAWLFRFMLAGRAREMGLGSEADVTLAEARTRAAEARKLVKDGTDPIERRDADRRARDQAAALERAQAMTFRQCAEAFIEAHQAGWKNAKHRYQWPATLRDYVFPVFGDLPVQAVDLPMVMKAVEPIWTTETASRVRGLIESILDWATVRGFRQGENPARWRGQLAHLLPAKAKVQAMSTTRRCPTPRSAPLSPRCGLVTPWPLVRSNSPS